jgi:hypothetical protein
MAAGLYGTAVAIIIDALYSVFHVLWPVTSKSDSPMYFLLELVLIMLATAGSFVVAAHAPLGSFLLVLAVLGAFGTLGWWALLIAPLWLLAAFLACLDFAISEGRLRSTDQENGKTSPHSVLRGGRSLMPVQLPDVPGSRPMREGQRALKQREEAEDARCPARTER